MRLPAVTSYALRPVDRRAVGDVGLGILLFVERRLRQRRARAHAEYPQEEEQRNGLTDAGHRKASERLLRRLARAVNGRLAGGPVGPQLVFDLTSRRDRKNA